MYTLNVRLRQLLGGPGPPTQAPPPRPPPVPNVMPTHILRFSQLSFFTCTIDSSDMQSDDMIVISRTLMVVTVTSAALVVLFLTVTVFVLGVLLGMCGKRKKQASVSAPNGEVGTPSFTELENAADAVESEKAHDYEVVALGDTARDIKNYSNNVAYGSVICQDTKICQ